MVTTIFLIIGLVGGLCLLIFMFKEAFGNQVKYEYLSFPDFPNSFGEWRLFFISDVHRRVISDQIIQEVKGNADLVIIGGDLLEKGVSFQQVTRNIKKLKEIGPIYFVFGNNDYEVDIDKLYSLLRENGVIILDNKSVVIKSKEGESIALIGLEDMSVDRDRIDLALEDCKEDEFKVLICHNPDVLAELEDQYNIRLVLSGHTHGGQIRILGFSPYDKGKIKVSGNKTILISNGYGTTSIPLRLGAKAETHLVNIRNENIKFD